MQNTASDLPEEEPTEEEYMTKSKTLMEVGYPLLPLVFPLKKDSYLKRLWEGRFLHSVYLEF